MRRKLCLVVLCLMVAGCTGGAFPDLSSGLPESPPREHMEAMAKLLPPQEGKELLVWWAEHNDLLDGRVHTGKTCPFIVWIPKKAEHDAGTMSDLKWAKFMHKFYRYKHKEEKDCDCEELLGTAKPKMPDPAAPGAPTPPPDTPPPAKPDPPDDDDDDDDEDDTEKRLKELLKEWLKNKGHDLPEIKPK